MGLVITAACRTPREIEHSRRPTFLADWHDSPFSAARMRETKKQKVKRKPIFNGLRAHRWKFPCTCPQGRPNLVQTVPLWLESTWTPFACQRPQTESRARNQPIVRKTKEWTASWNKYCWLAAGYGTKWLVIYLCTLILSTGTADAFFSRLIYY